MNQKIKEIWKIVKNTESRYRVSSLGRVQFFNLELNKWIDLKRKYNRNNKRPRISIKKSNFKKETTINVCNVVAGEFLDPPKSKGYTIFYKDDDFENCAVDNIYWGRIPVYEKYLQELTCPSCGETKTRGAFRNQGTTYGKICYRCYVKQNPHCSPLGRIESTCPMCRKKHKAYAKWVYCDNCKKIMRSWNERY